MRKFAFLLIMMSFIIWTTGCGTESGSPISSNVDFGKDDYKNIVSSNNQLGFKLFSEVDTNEDGNIFISPTSLFMALSMVLNGADGVTKEEITKVLHVEKLDLNELNKANASLMSVLYNNSKQIQLNVANSMWLNEDFHFQTDFAQNNKDYFNAEVHEIDISDKKSPKMINDWVQENTNDKIEKMVDPPLDPNLVAILLNAVYFKGDWKYEFDKKRTEKEHFHVGNGTTKELPLMTLTEELSYMENKDFQVVSLPYGAGEMSMKVFLPKEDSSLEEFKKELSDENWNNWNSEFYEREGTIQLPKFQMEYEINLNEALENLGMATAFYDNANFTKMIEEDRPLKISNVKQKTFISVNEEGTEAAAATSVEVEEASASEPFYMKVDRPFFLVVTDDDSGTILFLGAISNPQEGK